MQYCSEAEEFLLRSVLKIAHTVNQLCVLCDKKVEEISGKKRCHPCVE